MIVLASPADVVTRLGRDLSAEEAAVTPGLLQEASILVEAYLGCPLTRWLGPDTDGDGVPDLPDEDGDGVPDTVPDAVRVVTSRMVARVLASRAFLSGADVSQQTVGPFSTTFTAGTTTGGPWLSASDQAGLKPYRCGSGLSVLTLAGEQVTAWWWGDDLEEGEHPVVWVDDAHQWWIVGAPSRWRTP